MESLTKEQRAELFIKESLEKEAIQQKFSDQLPTAPKIIFDLSFWDTMIFKELRSLMSQINICAKFMKDFELIYSIYLTSFTGKIKETWERVGLSKFYQVKKENLSKIVDDSFFENTIYLSPDAEETLLEYDTEATSFIIGGIVDRTINKYLTLQRAKELNIRWWKLPIIENLPNSTKTVLNINTVVEIILRYRCNGYNFKDAVEKAIPDRHKSK